MSAATMLHVACECPRVEECVNVPASRCWHCGGHLTRGVALDDWQGASFTGQNRIRGSGSTHVCEACIWVMARSSEVPGRPAKEGQSCGPNFRNYTHMLDDRGYVNASKGEKPAILAWLRGPKTGAWFAAIAESGQKHVVPYAPINPAGTTRGRVQFEESVIALPDERGWLLVDEMRELLTVGATKESIASGNYQPGEWQRCAEAIRAFEQARGRLRHGGWFGLALWLSQRDEDAVTARMAAEKESRDGKAKRQRERVVASADGGGAARPARSVSRQRGVSAQTLGSDPGPPASERAHDDERRGVAHGNVARPAARSGEQGRLF